MTQDEFNKYMEEARIIITHAGVGTIILGLKMNKKMIVAARKKEFKEHVNDHQEQILKTFSEEGYILALNDFDDLNDLINKDFKPKKYKSNTVEFNKKLKEEINNMIKK